MVSIVIAAHGRPEELRRTLRALARQTYRPLEMIVVDDGSPDPLAPIVAEAWPDAVVIRHDASVGAHRSRSEAMRRATGDYILTADDDSNPVEPDAIQRAVDRFGREPRLGIIAFFVDESLETGPGPIGAGQRYVNGFINCGQMMRTSVAREVGGYRDFYYYYSEEDDYALRVLDRGWRILFAPTLVVHHRRSPVGRERGRVVGYRLRNSLWTIVLDYPLPRALTAGLFKAAGGAWEIVRLGEWRWGAWAFGSCLAGLPRVWRNRRPVAGDTMRRFDLLKFRWIATPGELEGGGSISFAERVRWYRHVWPARRRFGAGDETQREDAGSLLFLVHPPPGH